MTTARTRCEAPSARARSVASSMAARSIPAGSSASAHSSVGHGTPAGCSGKAPSGLLGSGLGLTDAGAALGLRLTVPVGDAVQAPRTKAAAKTPRRQVLLVIGCLA